VRRWERIIPFLAFEPEIRKGIAVELLNMSWRKIIKIRGSIPSEPASLKLP